MDFDIVQYGPNVFFVGGDIDLNTSPLLYQAIEPVLETGGPIFLDFSAVSFIDSSGITRAHSCRSWPSIWMRRGPRSPPAGQEGVRSDGDRRVRQHACHPMRGRAVPGRVDAMAYLGGQLALSP